MRLIGLVIGVVVILAGALGVAAPAVLLSLGRSVATPAGLYAIAAGRIAIGVIFLLAAPASRAPRAIRVLSIIVIIAGVATPWFGVARTLRALDWAAAEPLFPRLVAGMVMVLGGFLIYAFRAGDDRR